MNTQQCPHPEFDFDPPLQRKKNRLREQFEKFHSENPHVFDGLHKLAVQYRAARPDKKIGISLLFEVLRWHTMLETKSDDGLKLNNNLRSFYSRELMKDPRLAGMFRLKFSAADEEVE
jgi:hypothetical protein